MTDDQKYKIIPARDFKLVETRETSPSVKAPSSELWRKHYD